jgi:hypothetical protein
MSKFASGSGFGAFRTTGSDSLGKSSSISSSLSSQNPAGAWIAGKPCNASSFWRFSVKTSPHLHLSFLPSKLCLTGYLEPHLGQTAVMRIVTSTHSDHFSRSVTYSNKPGATEDPVISPKNSEMLLTKDIPLVFPLRKIPILTKNIRMLMSTKTKNIDADI